MGRLNVLMWRWRVANTGTLFSRKAAKRLEVVHAPNGVLELTCSSRGWYRDCERVEGSKKKCGVSIFDNEVSAPQSACCAVAFNDCQ